MENNRHVHGHHPPEENHEMAIEKNNAFKLAIKATLHCLLGCGIGEVAGMIIATAVGMTVINSMILAVVLGFFAGLGLGVLPIIKAGFTFQQALKLVIIGEGLSIVVMEAFEVLTQIIIPGVLHASLSHPIFWIGMIAALIVGFFAALPVNYIMIKRGIIHRH